MRYSVERRADAETALRLIAGFAPAWASVLYTDELGSYLPIWAELGICHSAVKHSYRGERPHEWARDDDGDGRREVHCNSCEGAGAGLRTYLRQFRGVHKRHLGAYVAVYQTMTNAAAISPAIVGRMCRGRAVLQSGYT